MGLPIDIHKSREIIICPSDVIPIQDLNLAPYITGFSFVVDRSKGADLEYPPDLYLFHHLQYENLQKA